MDNGFDAVITRIKNKLCLNSIKELRDLLGFTHVAYYERRRRNALPYEKIFELCLNYGISIDYVFGITDEFKNDQSRTSFNIKIQKYKNYKSFGDDTHAEPFYIYDEFCDDPYAKLSAVIADNIYMFPVIDVGDILIVNENEKEIIEDGKLFLVKYKGNVSVTRLFKTIDPEEVIMKFESQLHQEVTSKLKNIIILGKVKSLHRSMV